MHEVTSENCSLVIFENLLVFAILRLVVVLGKHNFIFRIEITESQRRSLGEVHMPSRFKLCNKKRYQSLYNVSQHAFLYINREKEVVVVIVCMFKHHRSPRLQGILTQKDFPTYKECGILISRKKLADILRAFSDTSDAGGS